MRPAVIHGEPAARHDHVQVRMMGHCRAPGVQYRRDADAGSEVLRVGRDPEHRLRRGLEQQIVDHGLVLVGDVANRRRQREDDVELGTREQFGLARRHPLARCRALARAEWLARRQAELLPVPYFHVVFTLPMLAGEIAFQNKATVYAILFRAVAETLTTIAADLK